MYIAAFEQYQKPGVRAIYHRVPIGYLEQFRQTMAYYGKFYKVRYRGPRFTVPSARYRSFMSKASTCLKRDATHFSVYQY
jgi:hypothetical protein